MDKETLSNYGWIVICVLVLAVMIALATPFGQFISDAIWGTTEGLFDTNQNALGATGLIDTTEYIEISSEEDIYALARILSLENTKNNFYGSNYKIEDDFDRFEYPEEVTDNKSKRTYLANASYKLMNDVSLTFQRANDTTFFTGIGSTDHPFMGTFNGNGKTITLASNGEISFNANMNPTLSFIGRATNAKIINTNIKVENDIIVNRCATRLNVAPLAGKIVNCEVSNCNITIINSNIGVSYAAGESYVSQVYVGGIVGECDSSIIRDCTVTLNDSTLQAKAYDVSTGAMYANFSVGGILGFSRPGSDNTNNIGQIGNQVINCKVISNNTSQRDVIIGSIRNGEEVTAGGLIGCTFNNFVAKNCSVNIMNGNIVAEKTGTTDTASEYGTTAGGLVGRLEHTGELYNCTVNGNHLNIIAKSPENYTTVGGIVGMDTGAYHRDIITINKCSFNGNGTSNIVLDVTADSVVNKWNAMGGIVGYGCYQIKDCTAQGVTLTNHSTNIEKCYVGGICGLYNNKSGFWTSGTYFEPQSSGMINCKTSGIVFDTTSNVKTGEMYAFEQ